MKLIIFGAQASGKGTQAEILAERLNLTKLSSGDIFREEIKNKTELGEKAASYINKGNFIPDELVMEVMKGKIEEHDNFILDGTPRNINQAKILETITQIDKVIYIDISDDEAVKRMSSRRVCPQCGATYNMISKKPKKDELCDVCNIKLKTRDDDKEEAVRKRLELFHEQTEPLLDFYEKKGILLRIDGMPSIPEVTESIKQALGQ